MRHHCYPSRILFVSSLLLWSLLCAVTVATPYLNNENTLQPATPLHTVSNNNMKPVSSACADSLERPGYVVVLRPSSAVSISRDEPQMSYPGRTTVTSSGSRALLQFELDTAIQVDGTFEILCAELQLQSDGLPSASTPVPPLSLHRLSNPWSSSFTSLSEGPRSAYAGDVTWLFANYPNQAWELPGGDFDQDVTLSTSQKVKTTPKHHDDDDKTKNTAETKKEMQILHMASTHAWERTLEDTFRGYLPNHGWILVSTVEGDDPNAVDGLSVDHAHLYIRYQGKHAPSADVAYKPGSHQLPQPKHSSPPKPGSGSESLTNLNPSAANHRDSNNLGVAVIATLATLAVVVVLGVVSKVVAHPKEPPPLHHMEEHVYRDDDNDNNNDNGNGGYSDQAPNDLEMVETTTEPRIV